MLVAVLVVVAIAVFALTRSGSGTSDASDEDRIRTTIDTFTAALVDGDLATLRTVTCGPLATFYERIPDDDFAATHEASVASGTVPVVESIDAVQISEAEPPDTTTAIAQVTASTQSTGSSSRTFDLALDGDTWKVCA